ncbi:MAG: glycosyltransferase family 4 protein [Planctomycetota bacterium]
MRYLFVSTNVSTAYGGSEVLWSKSAEVLGRDGAEVACEVQWFPVEGPHTSRLREMGVKVHWRRRTNWSRRIERLRSKVGPSGTSAAFREPWDLVVISEGIFGEAASWAEQCLRCGLRYVLITQAASESWPIVDDRLSSVADAVNGAERAFFVSRANLDLARAQIAEPIEHGEVVQNPFNVSPTAAPAWPDTDPSHELRLACVARLDVAAKGQDILLEVMSMPKWRKRALSLSFFGRGAQQTLLRKLAERHGLERVTWGGYAGDIEAVWEKHHALLLASRFEGLPLALVEAMLCGRAAVVTDVAGNTEMVEDGVSGFVAEAATVRHVDAALERAWSARGELRAMGRAAAKSARARVPVDPVAVFSKRLAEVASA